MFKIIKWIVILVVLAVVALLLWWNGVFGTPAASQPAAVINSSGSTGFDQTKQKLREFVVPDKKTEEQKVAMPQQQEQTEEKEDIFEIPAFLRQRN